MNIPILKWAKKTEAGYHMHTEVRKQLVGKATYCDSNYMTFGKRQN